MLANGGAFMRSSYDDVVKRIDSDLLQIERDIQNLNGEKERLLQARDLLTCDKQLSIIQNPPKIATEKSEKLKQSALLRHKKAREEKSKEITELLKVNERMTTMEIAAAINRTRESTMKILKEGDFIRVGEGIWSLKSDLAE